MVEWPSLAGQARVRLAPLTSEEMEHTAKEVRKGPLSVLTITTAAVHAGSLPPGNPFFDELSVAGSDGYYVSSLKRRATLASTLRVMSYVLRFIARIKSAKEKKSPRLTAVANTILHHGKGKGRRSCHVDENCSA